jgi:hypothetical protein
MVQDADMCCSKKNKKQWGERIWMLPDHWDDWGEQLVHSYQYITMKIKLLFTFEQEVEVATVETLKELMYFPKLDNIYFPSHYFKALLRHLTDEQLDYLDK